MSESSQFLCGTQRQADQLWNVSLFPTTFSEQPANDAELTGKSRREAKTPRISSSFEGQSRILRW
jgi:hypothetical protein